VSGRQAFVNVRNHLVETRGNVFRQRGNACGDNARFTTADRQVSGNAGRIRRGSHSRSTRVQPTFKRAEREVVHPCKVTAE